MKARYENEYILLENGIKFLRRENESDDLFVTRVSQQIENDYCQSLELTGIELEGIDKEVREVVPEGPYANKGKFCTVARRLTGEVVSGKIIWVYLDKRKGLLYYRIKTGSGIVITRVNNKTLQII